MCTTQWSANQDNMLPVATHKTAGYLQHLLVSFGYTHDLQSTVADQEGQEPPIHHCVVLWK